MSAVPVTIVGVAYLTDVGVGGGPVIPPPGTPPGIWGGAPIPWPTPPIYYPPGIWGPNDPRPGWGLPGTPPGIWGGAPIPWPTPPIYYPPGIWGPTDPRPGWGLPGNQPGIWPGPGPLPYPEHPIAPGGPPPGIWGGAPVPVPTPPIHIPPPVDPPNVADGGRWVWHPVYGWVWYPVGGGGKPHPPQGPGELPPDQEPHPEHPIELPPAT